MNNLKSYETALFEAKQDTLNYYFMDAVNRADMEKAIDLLDAGADPNSRFAPGQGWGHGIGPIHVLVSSKNTNKTKEFIKELVSRGSDPNAQSLDGETPLHRLNWDPRKWKFVDLLIELGADPNIKNNKGKTPLDLCIEDSLEHPGSRWATEKLKIAKRLLIGGAKGNPSDIIKVFQDDLSWWKNAPEDIREKSQRIIKTRGLFKR